MLDVVKRYAEMVKANERYPAKHEVALTALAREIREEAARVCDQNVAACEARYRKSGGVAGYAFQAEGSQECADMIRSLNGK